MLTFYGKQFIGKIENSGKNISKRSFWDDISTEISKGNLLNDDKNFYKREKKFHRELARPTATWESLNEI